MMCSSGFNNLADSAQGGRGLHSVKFDSSAQQGAADVCPADFDPAGSDLTQEVGVAAHNHWFAVTASQGESFFVICHSGTAIENFD